MTTPLEKTLKRALTIKGHDYVVAISPEGLKLTAKGKRNGVELAWENLISGEAALAVALHASLGKFAAPSNGSSDKVRPKGDEPQPKRAEPRPKRDERRPKRVRR
jgi:hypothetical protein